MPPQYSTLDPSEAVEDTSAISTLDPSEAVEDPAVAALSKTLRGNLDTSAPALRGFDTDQNRGIPGFLHPPAQQPTLSALTPDEQQVNRFTPAASQFVPQRVDAANRSWAPRMPAAPQTLGEQLAPPDLTTDVVPGAPVRLQQPQTARQVADTTPLDSADALEARGRQLDDLRKAGQISAVEYGRRLFDLQQQYRQLSGAPTDQVQGVKDDVRGAWEGFRDAPQTFAEGAQMVGQGDGGFVPGARRMVSGALAGSAPLIALEMRNPVAARALVAAFSVGSDATTAANNVAQRFGADDDTRELIGQVAGLLVGAGAAGVGHGLVRYEPNTSSEPAAKSKPEVIPPNGSDSAAAAGENIRNAEWSDVTQHPAGKVTGIDQETGLPIVDRSAQKAEASARARAGQQQQNAGPDLDTIFNKMRQGIDLTPDEKAFMDARVQGQQPQPSGTPTSAPQNENVEAVDTSEQSVENSTENRHVTDEGTKPVGSEDPESGRVVTQPTDKLAEAQKLATAAAPELETKLKQLTAGVDGAEVDGVREAKDRDRAIEKSNKQGQPPETISDLLAARIAVDSLRARAEVVDRLRKQFPVVKEEDQFEKGDPDYGHRSHDVQVQMSNGSTAEVQIVPKEIAAVEPETHDNYETGREAELAGDTEGARAAQAANRKIHDAAMERFNQRQQEQAAGDSEHTPVLDASEAAPESAQHTPVLDSTEAAPETVTFAKGDRVILPDGTKGTVSYADKNLKVARVKKDGGGSVSLASKDLKPEGNSDDGNSSGNTAVTKRSDEQQENAPIQNERSRTAGAPAQPQVREESGGGRAGSREDARSTESAHEAAAGPDAEIVEQSTGGQWPKDPKQTYRWDVLLSQARSREQNLAGTHGRVISLPGGGERIEITHDGMSWIEKLVLKTPPGMKTDALHVSNGTGTEAFLKLLRLVGKGDLADLVAAHPTSAGGFIVVRPGAPDFGIREENHHAWHSLHPDLHSAGTQAARNAAPEAYQRAYSALQADPNYSGYDQTKLESEIAAKVAAGSPLDISDGDKQAIHDAYVEGAEKANGGRLDDFPDVAEERRGKRQGKAKTGSSEPVARDGQGRNDQRSEKPAAPAEKQKGLAAKGKDGVFPVTPEDVKTGEPSDHQPRAEGGQFAELPDGVQQVFPAEEVSRTGKNFEGRYLKAALDPLKQAWDKKLANVPDVGFTEPVKRNGRRELTARLRTGQADAPRLHIREGRDHMFSVVFEDYHTPAGTKQPITVSQTLADGLSLQAAKSVAEGRLRSGSLTDSDKPFLHNSREVKGYKPARNSIGKPTGFKGEKIFVKVPGDGQFTIPNNPAAIESAIVKAGRFAPSWSRDHLSHLRTPKAPKEFDTAKHIANLKRQLEEHETDLRRAQKDPSAHGQIPYHQEQIAALKGALREAESNGVEGAEDQITRAASQVRGSASSAVGNIDGTAMTPQGQLKMKRAFYSSIQRNVQGFDFGEEPGDDRHSPAIILSHDALAMMEKSNMKPGTYGFHVPPADATTFAGIWRSLAKDPRLAAYPDAQKRMAALADRIGQLNTGPAGVVFMREGATGDVYGQEQWHRWALENPEAHAAGVERSRNENPEAWGRAENHLRQQRYRGDEMDREVPGHVAAGSDAGLTKQEQRAVLTSYLKGISEHGGTEILRGIPDVHPEFGDIIKGALDDRGSTEASSGGISQGSEERTNSRELGRKGEAGLGKPGSGWGESSGADEPGGGRRGEPAGGSGGDLDFADAFKDLAESEGVDFSQETPKGWGHVDAGEHNENQLAQARSAKENLERGRDQVDVIPARKNHAPIVSLGHDLIALLRKEVLGKNFNGVHISPRGAEWMLANFPRMGLQKLADAIRDNRSRDGGAILAVKGLGKNVLDEEHWHDFQGLNPEAHRAGVRRVIQDHPDVYREVAAQIRNTRGYGAISDSDMGKEVTAKAVSGSSIDMDLDHAEDIHNSYIAGMEEHTPGIMEHAPDRDPRFTGDKYGRGESVGGRDQEALGGGEADVSRWGTDESRQLGSGRPGEPEGSGPEGEFSLRRTPTDAPPNRPGDSRLTDLDEGLDELGPKYDADVLRAHALLERLPGTPADQAQAYHYFENPREPLTPTQREIVSKLGPMRQQSEAIFHKLYPDRPFTANYIHRIAQQKGSFLDRLLKRAQGAGKGNLLKKNAAAGKQRSMMAIESPKGERTVVSVSRGRVTGWQNNVPTDLGPLRAGMTNPDEILDERLEALNREESRLRQEQRTLNRNQGTQAAAAKRLRNIANRLREIEDARGRIEHDHLAENLPNKVWRDKDGNFYRFTQATTKEIERHTPVRYYHNAAASTVTSWLELRKAERANDFLEALKGDPSFSAVAVRPKNPGQIPQEWRSTQLPQLNGYYFEPHLADIFDRYAKELVHDPGVIEKAANLLVTAIFLNPVAHLPNLTFNWAAEKGLSPANPGTWLPEIKAGLRAINAVVHQNGDFLAALDAGAPMQSQRRMVQGFAKQLIKTLQSDAGRTTLEKIQDALGSAIDVPAGLRWLVDSMSGKLTWPIHDMYYLQSTFLKQAQRGMPMDAALRDTASYIPNERIPTHILGSRRVGDLLRSPAFMFTRYRYGTLKALGNIMTRAVGAGFKPTDTDARGNPINEAGRTRGDEARRALNIATGLVIMAAVILPEVDDLLKKVTGNKDARFRRSGLLAIPDAAYRAAKGEITPAQAMRNVISPTVAVEGAADLAVNRDLLGTGRKIYNEHGTGEEIGKEIGTFALKMLSPAQIAMRASESHESFKRTLWSLVGVSFPRSGVERLAAELHAAHMPDNAQTPEERRKSTLRTQARYLLWQGDRSGIEAAKKSGLFKPEELDRIEKAGKEDPLRYEATGLSVEDLAKLIEFRGTTPEQAKMLKGMLQAKGLAAINAPLGKRAAAIQRWQKAMDEVKRK